MTWQGERRKQLPSNWGQICKLVLERDGYQCTVEMVQVESGSVILTYPRCPNRATDVDHANGPLDHRLSSLRSLCAFHEAIVSRRPTLGDPYA